MKKLQKHYMNILRSLDEPTQQSSLTVTAGDLATVILYIFICRRVLKTLDLTVLRSQFNITFIHEKFSSIVPVHDL